MHGSCASRPPRLRSRAGASQPSCCLPREELGKDSHWQAALESLKVACSSQTWDPMRQTDLLPKAKRSAHTLPVFCWVSGLRSGLGCPVLSSALFCHSRPKSVHSLQEWEGQRGAVYARTLQVLAVYLTAESTGRQLTSSTVRRQAFCHGCS